MDSIDKYPRTRHIEGSGIQIGDDHDAAPWSELAGKNLIVEEKIDGANCGISFDSSGQLRLQSRGHFLAGGPRERQFELLKGWAARYTADLWGLLGRRYVLYGEWCYGKHSIFYTDLPHYLLEFDLYDRDHRSFLSTDRRRELLRDAPFIRSVRVLHQGTMPSLAALHALIGPSLFIAPDHRAQLCDATLAAGIDQAQALRETDPSGLMEGLYVKIEQEGVVAERYKFVRAGFLQTVLDSGSHWMDRPLLPNRLGADVSLW
jgi:hypothetical protein